MYANSYTLKEHHDNEHCDGLLVFYCLECTAFVPNESVCKKCEGKAQAAKEKKRQQELRRKELADRKKALELEIDKSCRKAISAPVSKKCRVDGNIYGPSYLDEEHHDNEHCDGPLDFYCQICKKWVPSVICDACEKREQEKRREQEEKQERRRRELEEQERQRKEREEKLRREREKEEKRQKIFVQMTKIPSYLALLLAILCMLLTSQLFIYGSFVPLAYVVFVCSLVLAILFAVSLFVVAAFF